MSYETSIKLEHHEAPAKLDKKTNKFTEIIKKPNNLPKNNSLLKYKEFYIKNRKFMGILKPLNILTLEEFGLVDYMCAIAEFKSNSLKPLNNDTTVRDLEEIFGIPKNRIRKTFDKLFRLGVFMQVKVHQEDLKEYWVLNPNISWKGELSDDSIFSHFKNTTITNLLTKQSI